MGSMGSRSYFGAKKDRPSRIKCGSSRHSHNDRVGTALGSTTYSEGSETLDINLAGDGRDHNNKDLAESAFSSSLIETSREEKIANVEWQFSQNVYSYRARDGNLEVLTIGEVKSRACCVLEMLDRDTFQNPGV